MIILNDIDILDIVSLLSSGVTKIQPTSCHTSILASSTGSVLRMNYA